MINGKKVMAIIPARAGSKGLPGKNIKEICGKPLIAWTIEKALRSRHLDLVMVSTDSREIADIAEGYGATVPFLRPAALASDTAGSFEVVRHALDHFRTVRGEAFDYTLLLEPTSPLREDDDIDRVIEELDGSCGEFDSLVTLGEVGEHPSIMKRLAGRGIAPFCADLPMTGRRQDNVPAYFPYGVAYLVKTACLLAEQTFYTKRCLGFPIRDYQKYEIDDIYDFICTEAVMRYEWKLP